jgi:co-chaperonin GroES (HSP10)
MSHLQPLRDRVLVRPIPFETKTEGGILLGAPLYSDVRQGEVLELGPGANRELFHQGDIVLYQVNAGKEITFMGTDTVLLDEYDCLAIVCTH